MTEENGQGGVAQRKAERKLERKAVREAVRDERRVERRWRRRLAETLEPLPIRERIRNQWEVLELERRFLEDLDQSVRYVLIVFGVINTAAVLVLARGNLLSGGSGPTEWGVRLFVALYALLAVITLRDALRSLRPPLVAAALTRIGAPPARPQDGSEKPVAVAVLPMGATRPSEEDYHGAWQRISGEELSREVSMSLLALSGLGTSKLAALHKLYADVTLSLVLTAVLIAAALVASAL